MIAGEHRDVALVLRVLVPVEVLIQKTADAAASVLFEIAVVLAFMVAIVAHEGRVAAPRHVEAEVAVVSGAESQRGIAPFGDHRCVRELEVQHAAHVSPDAARAGLLLVVIFDERGGHVHAESVTALLKPEAHDVFDCLAGRGRGRVVRGQLPRLLNLKETVIEGRLALEKVEDIGPAAFALAADIRETGRCVKAEVRPDEAVGIFISVRLLAHAEPLMLLGGVPRHEIKQHADAHVVRSVEEPDQILVRAIARRHLLVVTDVIAGVLKGRVKAGVDPQGVAAQVFDVAELFDDAVYVADAIPVCVIEGLRINFVKDCVFQPCCCHDGFPLSYYK